MTEARLIEMAKEEGYHKGIAYMAGVHDAQREHAREEARALRRILYVLALERGPLRVSRLELMNASGPNDAHIVTHTDPATGDYIIEAVR